MSKDHPGYCVSCDAMSDEELCVKCDGDDWTDADGVNRLLVLEAELNRQVEINKRQAERIKYLEVLITDPELSYSYPARMTAADKS